ncbi:hypothetical protein ACIGHB_28760 [Streptomyces sp. NPDC085460]
MPAVWIGFNAYDRHRYWWRNGLVMLALTGVITAMSLIDEPGKW